MIRPSQGSEPQQDVSNPESLDWQLYPLRHRAPQYTFRNSGKCIVTVRYPQPRLKSRPWLKQLLY